MEALSFCIVMRDDEEEHPPFPHISGTILSPPRSLAVDWNLMLKRLTLVFALLTLSSAVRAQTQTPEITPETPVTPRLLVQWLHSGDPRLIAWSATLAARDHDRPTVALMPALLQNWPIILGDSLSPNDTLAAHRRAIAAVLDTLIQEKFPVDQPTIKAIAESFPTQAAILIARLPITASQSTLHDWTYGATGTWGGRTLARLAAMMLAQDPHPDPNFVAEIVAAAEENLQVVIASTGADRLGMGSGTCGDSLGRGLITGWPQVYTYNLEENSSDSTSALLLDLDGDRITYRRHTENGGFGSCYGVENLNAITRHRLIAHWLGVSPRDMPWQPSESVTIVWKDLTDYQQQLGAAVESHRAQLEATYDTLYQNGTLRPGAMLAYSRPNFAGEALPILTVTIQCSITPCPLDLNK
jgi:hypothetical protein